jgi:hypothetical protein
MKKKGQAESTLAIVIIACAIGIILIVATGAWLNAMKKKTDIEGCRLSVLGKSYTKPGGKSPLELNCPRTLVNFESHKVTSTTSGTEITKKVIAKGVRTEKFNALSKDIVFQVVAEEARNCWYKMGEGKLIPFDQSLFFKTANICLVCDTFSFEPGLQETFLDFGKYLNDTEAPNLGMTYADYISRDVKQLQGPASGGQVAVDIGKRIALLGNYEFSTNLTYYLIYSAFSPSIVIKGPANFDSSLFRASEEKAIGLLFLVDADNISTLKCDMLYN